MCCSIDPTGGATIRPYATVPRASATLLIFLCLNAFVTATMSTSAKFYTIHWNSSNPIFRIDNTDNVIDVNRNNMKFEYDQVNLICPVYMPGTRDDDLEKYIIYNVSKEEYETCRITNANPRIIAVCDKPFKLMYFTITFRPFTPQPGGLEFLPGHDYYFISTSTSDDLHRRIGGRCSSHNMKIVFKVWAPPATTAVGGPGGGGVGSSGMDVSTTPTQNGPIGGLSTPTILQRPTASTNNNNNKWLPKVVGKPITSTVAPSGSGSPSSSSSTTTTTSSSSSSSSSITKKSKTYDKHPNEVVKSEELTLGGSKSGAASGRCFHSDAFVCYLCAGVLILFVDAILSRR